MYVGEAPGYLNNISRLIAFAAMRYRSEIGAISLNQQSIERDTSRGLP